MKGSRKASLLLPFALFGCISAEAFAASSSPPRADVLLGCYAQEANGPITIRINKENEHYSLVSIQKDGSSKKTFTLYSREAKPGQAKATEMIDALISDESGVIAVLKSKNGVPINTQGPGSDYYFHAPQVGGPLYKKPCPGAQDHTPT